jgi:anti-anti-sigma factor
MPTQITQHETEAGTILRVEGDLLVSDAVLLERIAAELVENGTKVRVDLADLDFMDSESAAVLRRLADDPAVELEGLEIFLQSAIDLAERNSRTQT